MDDGYWNDLTCSESLYYVCKRPYSSTPFEPMTTTTTAPESENCGHDWLEDTLTGICYRLFEEQMSSADASLHCQELDYYGTQSRPELVSLSVREEQTFVSSE